MSSKRQRSDYLIASAAKTLQVLKAVQTDDGRPIEFKKIVERTRFDRNFVLRAVYTLETDGYIEHRGDNWWTFTPQFLSFAASIRGV